MSSMFARPYFKSHNLERNLWPNKSFQDSEVEWISLTEAVIASDCFPSATCRTTLSDWSIWEDDYSMLDHCVGEWRRHSRWPEPAHIVSPLSSDEYIPDDCKKLSDTITSDILRLNWCKSVDNTVSTLEEVWYQVWLHWSDCVQSLLCKSDEYMNWKQPNKFQFLSKRSSRSELRHVASVFSNFGELEVFTVDIGNTREGAPKYVWKYVVGIPSALDCYVDWLSEHFKDWYACNSLEHEKRQLAKESSFYIASELVASKNSMLSKEFSAFELHMLASALRDTVGLYRKDMYLKSYQVRKARKTGARYLTRSNELPKEWISENQHGIYASRKYFGILPKKRHLARWR